MWITIQMIIEVLKSIFGLGSKPKAKRRPIKRAQTAKDLSLGAKKPTTAALMLAKHRLSRLESIERIRDAGYESFSLQDSNDERDCAWCKVNSGKKFPIDTDINKLIRESCACEYCRCWIRAERH